MAEERTVQIDAVHLVDDPAVDPPFWYRSVFDGDTDRPLADLLTDAAAEIGSLEDGDECGQVEVTVYAPGVWAPVSEPDRVWVTTDGLTWADKLTGVDYDPDRHP